MHGTMTTSFATQHFVAGRVIAGLGHQEESLLRLVVDEEESLNRLYNIVGHAGCDILLCDKGGDLIRYYGRAAAANYGSLRIGPRMGRIVAGDVAWIAPPNAVERTPSSREKFGILVSSPVESHRPPTNRQYAGCEPTVHFQRRW
jgi:hypothetical protein